ncbi:MAG: hypothetical protein ABSF44_10890 [Candidatus Bathyarchaeia archaeon]|jgi:hypothetical protein
MTQEVESEFRGNVQVYGSNPSENIGNAKLFKVKQEQGKNQPCLKGYVAIDPAKLVKKADGKLYANINFW